MRAYAVAALSAVVLTLAFPKVNAWFLAPFGVAGLFWALKDASWKRAFGLAWFAGVIFFSIMCWWWSTEIVSDVGVLAYVAVVIAAMIQGLYWGLAATLTRVAIKRAPAALAPAAFAAAFTVTEWLRSIGVTGNPFAQLGYTQADSPLRVFAAYIGTNGVTLILCLFGAYLTYAIATKQWRVLGGVCAGIVVLWIAAWLMWPARTLAEPRIPVAAVQGNIKQSLKWQPDSVRVAIDRYMQMTAALAPQHPQLIVWPETVIPIAGLNRDMPLQTQFTALASQLHATVLVGSVSVRDGSDYNSLYLFTPGGLSATYDKRQLVPFAEHFPGKSFLFWLPYIGQLNGKFSEGVVSGVYPTTTGLRIAPLICWESAFGDLAYDQIHNGAQVLVISTDDAWFGTSAGPYQHAQIAQMRAVEAGAYVVRSAATGISGIIAPDGHWQAQSQLETQESIVGHIAAPAGSAFSHYGPTPVFVVILLGYVVIVMIPKRRA